MKNTDDLNNIYWAIEQLSSVNQLIKDQLGYKYIEWNKENENIIENARKSYDRIKSKII